MGAPLISIGMPVYNGDAFLAEAIESLLNQDHREIALTILDNQSSDRSQDIAARYARRDSRVTFIVDDHKVPDVVAHKRLAQMAEGPFFIPACDDDVYDPRYLSTLLKVFDKDPEVGLVYSGFDHIYPDGRRVPVQMRASGRFRTAADSRVDNLKYFFFRRPVIPWVFGLLRIEVHRAAQASFNRVGPSQFDHDTLYMVHLLALTPIASVPDVLFSYRLPWSGTPKAGKSLPTPSWSRYVRQQLAVRQAASRILGASALPLKDRVVLHAYNDAACVFYCVVQQMLASRIVRTLRGRTGPTPGSASA